MVNHFLHGIAEAVDVALMSPIVGMNEVLQCFWEEDVDWQLGSSHNESYGARNVVLKLNLFHSAIS